MRYPMTPRGQSSLQRELKRLKSMRPELAKAIEIARGHGDLSENADYDAAKERSGMIEAKIRDLESRLSGAEVIDPKRISSFQRVVFGLSVRVQDVATDEARVYSIFGTEESDISRGWISYDSPLARQLLGKEEGDVVKVTLPGGSREFEICEIFLDYSEETEAEGSSE